MPKAKKILIIEDDANLLYGLQAKFRVENYETLADQGLDENETMEKIIAYKPDYVILDIILPKTNGLDLLKEIKAKPSVSGIPIFVFTNLSDNDSRQQAKKLGVDVYLLKTDFNLDQFVAEFKKIAANKEKMQ
ncbi:MAG: response regulator [Patescibacteria group bacterium]|nr:response regulator [Patescibacteria group bacterium]